MLRTFLRTVLVIAAWAYVGLGVVRAFDLVWGANQDFEHAGWSLIGNFVQAGVLLALLSIDKRIETRGQ